MRKFIGTLLAVTAMMCASIAGAQSEKQVVTGTVVTAGQDELTIDTPTGRMTFRLDSMLDRARYNDLKPGSRVQVTHKMDDQGVQHVVTDVMVLTEPSTTTPPATTPPAASDYSATGSQTSYANDQLPQTASPLWSIGLLAGGALLAGISIRALAREHRI
jgi:hypothetical protein